MTSLVSLLAAWSVLWLASVAALSPVTVLYCCPPGQALSDDALRATELTPAAAAAACAPIVGNDTRATRIYSLQFKRIVYEEPRHWRNKTGIPECESLRLLPEHAAPYALRGADGLMMVRGAPGSVLPPGRYCTDLQAALACAADVLWQPAKCCADGRAFDGQQCVPDEDGERAQAARDELLALANGSAVGSGWPACPAASRYSVAGALAGARLAERGALLLRGVAPRAVRRGAGGGRRLPGRHAGGGLRAAGGAPRAALALPDALRGGAHAGRRAAGGHAAGGRRGAGRAVPRAGGVYAFPVPVGVLLAQHNVFQHLVDFPGLPADVAGARAGAVAPARVRGVRVGRPAAAGGRGRGAGRAARRRRRALPAPALRRAALLVLRRHGDPRLLLRARGRAAARQPGALHLHHAPAHVRPVAPRRGQVHFGTGGAGTRVRQAGGGDGRDVGRGRGVVGGGRARLRVVRHGPAERAAGRVHLPGGGLPAARVGGAQARGGGVLRARGGRRAQHALVHAAAVVRGVAHAHHAGARRPRPRRPCRAAPAHPHGDRVLTLTLK